MGFLKKCSCFVYYELKKYDLFCWWIFPRWSDMCRRKDVRKCPPLFYPKSTEYAVTEKEQETQKNALTKANLIPTQRSENIS